MTGDANTMNIGAVAAAQPPQPPPPPAPKVILILAANPRGTDTLRLDEEQRAIDRAVHEGTLRGRLEIRVSNAMRVEDLHSALLRHRPSVLHFSGHGSAREGIVFCDQLGIPRPVPPRGLAGVLGSAGIGATIDCVVLNACSTSDQAAAIAQHVACVVGMSHLVPDETAIMFAEGFYRGVAYGQSVRSAFDLGVNAAVLKGLGGADLPRLIAGPGVAERMVIAAG
jgi:hypothetical protein